MKTTPYFTNPKAFRLLGKRLFMVAVKLSRQPDSWNKAEIVEAIRDTKGRRKRLTIERAAFEIAQLRDDMRTARHHRAYRKLGRSVLCKYARYNGGFGLRVEPFWESAFLAECNHPTLSQRLADRKASEIAHQRHIHLSAVGQHFAQAYGKRHHVEFTFVDDPGEVHFVGHSEKKKHPYCRIWEQTESHWSVALPRDWWDRVRTMHESISNAYLGIAILDCKLLEHPEAKHPELYGGLSVREGHYAVKFAVQRRGFRISTEDGFVVRRTVLPYNNQGELVENIYRYGFTLKQAIRATDFADPYLRAHRDRQAEARREANNQRLQEALGTLKLLQSGHRSIDTLNEREKLDLLRVVQDQIANAQKRTATFGGIGQRAIHAEPHCAAA